MKRSFQLPKIKSSSNKLVLGFVGASVAAIVGTAGFAAAQQFTPASNPTIPSSKEACKNGGWQALGFKNQGQCIAAFNHSHGHGYGHDDGDDNEDHDGHGDNGNHGDHGGHGNHDEDNDNGHGDD